MSIPRTAHPSHPSCWWRRVTVGAGLTECRALPRDQTAGRCLTVCRPNWARPHCRYCCLLYLSLLLLLSLLISPSLSQSLPLSLSLSQSLLLSRCCCFLGRCHCRCHDPVAITSADQNAGRWSPCVFDLTDCSAPPPLPDCRAPPHCVPIRLQGTASLRVSARPHCRFCCCCCCCCTRNCLCRYIHRCRGHGPLR